LSGTGKTTLSIDENVNLIGDDEHGWDEKGIFNIEGGCYAKTIHLSKEKEPFIYNAINSKALLENVCLKDGIPDYDDNSITENGRVSYPLENVENLQSPPEGGHPSFIFFLCCDAFGVLPPIVKLSPEQAMYYFLSGYTAKVAGTERGVNEPQATFSACFGEAFLPLHPTKYADLLQEKITKHNVPIFMINTGWSGGSYGVGKRMDIDVTRSCIDSVVNMTPGEMEETFTVKDEHFNFFLPSKLPKLKGSSTILNPINTWDDSSQFEKTKKMLITKFQENYQKYQKEGMTDFSVYGPKNKF
jgi:phosphoenolpyruvate carboxykinase (ATP)